MVIHVLLVEDDDSHTSLLQSAFDESAADWRVERVKTLSGARSSLASSSQDLVIADWRLPDGKGLDLLDGEASTPALPVVLMTSWGDEKLAVEAMRRGVLDYVVKSEETLAAMPIVARRALKEWDNIRQRCEAQRALLIAYDRLELMVAERTAELSAANEKLRELDKLKGMFIASMNHELRTPLNAIIGFSSILLQGMAGPLSEEQGRQLMMVKKSADHLLSLINDLIDINRIEGGQLKPELGVFDLAGCVRDAVNACTLQAGEKRIELVCETREDVPLFSDERRVRQIVMNLVSNAVKFTERGTVRITLGEAGDWMVLSVIDTGPGIREEDMKKLFLPFSRVGGEGAPRCEGTGLGLYLSRRIADLLGGEIAVESIHGEGSTFSLRLPRGHPPPAGD